MFYLKRYGKTLTYVIALGYLFSIWMFIVSVVIEEQIKNLEVKLITFEIFIFMLILSLNDLSAKTWIKSLLPADEYPKMVAKTVIAYYFASLIGCGGFFFLTSRDLLTMRTFL